MNHVSQADFFGNPLISLNSIKILPAQSQITHTLRFVTPPSRSVMAENVGGNKPLSEFMLLVLEHVAKRMKGREINASSGLLNIIDSITTDISSRPEHQQKDGTQNMQQGKQKPGAEDAETRL